MNPHQEAEGIWQVSQEIDDAGADGNLSNTDAFAYEANTVTIMLMSISKFKGMSEDQCYRLESRWSGDTLSIRYPNGSWDALATLVDGHFEMKGDGKRRVFAKIKKEEILDYNRPIVKADRPVYEYEIAEQ